MIALLAVVKSDSTPARWTAAKSYRSQMASESASEPVIARRALISGRVQGVWFRDSLRRLAESLAVAGWARNRSDGSVELWAEGPAGAVGKLLEYAREGPPRAVVERVDIEPASPAGHHCFEVR
jgi:acylphosphatase